MFTVDKSGGARYIYNGLIRISSIYGVTCLFSYFIFNFIFPVLIYLFIFVVGLHFLLSTVAMTVLFLSRFVVCLWNTIIHEPLDLTWWNFCTNTSWLCSISWHLVAARDAATVTSHWRFVSSVDFSTWRGRWLLPVAFWSANWYTGYSCPGERLNANCGFKAFRSGVRSPFGTDRQTDGRADRARHVANMKRPHNNLLSFLSLYLICVDMHKPG